MRLDYVVTLKNDYTEKEMLALCEQCTDEIRNRYKLTAKAFKLIVPNAVRKRFNLCFKHILGKRKIH